jgi:hypothetical protein
MSLNLLSRPGADERRWKLILELLEVELWCFRSRIDGVEEERQCGR